MNKNAEQIISVMLDKNEELGARDDAAMSLEEYPIPIVFEALITQCKANKGKENAIGVSNEFIVDATAGEILGEMVAKGHLAVSEDTISEFSQASKNEFLAAIH